ncbi:MULTISPECIES: hypothetical protein [unclassified Ensifer]|uniref:hypothetical protein n=1 Tax=unclassified Ensifer TaxID=2633371 RepID=UPI00081355F4|nr:MULTISPECIES: hypothetical protein [unclassified Ensifer]OCP16877.1 hypothetical protein BC363_10350 [Ensifer sp. LC384]OCP24039.1 hypothetical protein BC361_02460 [Ensifer sp. LC54]OCP37261.1 hypothetical protein BC360_07405 [Ensifer sp. LC163]
MDMMAMAYMADMAMKSRRWDEHFDPKPPGLLRRTFRRCIAALAARRKLKTVEQPAQTRCAAQPVDRAALCYSAARQI